MRSVPKLYEQSPKSFCWTRRFKAGGEWKQKKITIQAQTKKEAAKIQLQQIAEFQAADDADRILRRTLPPPDWAHPEDLRLTFAEWLARCRKLIPVPEEADFLRRLEFRTKIRPSVQYAGTPCWTCGTGKGYPKVAIGSWSCPVHRASYELFIGPIPHGYVIDHLCRNKRCWNPKHLEAVTLAVNLARGSCEREK